MPRNDTVSVPLKIAVFGGLGHMASPMALHWKGHVQVVRVHDRGTQGPQKDLRRKQWLAHGASLVSTFEEVVKDGDIDGVLICCGKNGDDLPIVSRTARLLGKTGSDKFICHMSTVSTSFVGLTEGYCRRHGVEYVNYPLTGGPRGAENATMLILASGSLELFSRLQPSLNRIGSPRYFGDNPAAAAEVKFIGHMMVFNSLWGVVSALGAHAELFEEGRLGSVAQSDLFDFLNLGAGGNKQWELAVSAGIRHGIWDAPFLARYAAIDALYTAQMALQAGISKYAVTPLIQMCLAFGYLAGNIDEKLATQALVREVTRRRCGLFDEFLTDHLAGESDPQAALRRCLASLPPAIQESAMPFVRAADFD